MIGWEELKKPIEATEYIVIVFWGGGAPAPFQTPIYVEGGSCAPSTPATFFDWRLVFKFTDDFIRIIISVDAQSILELGDGDGQQTN